MSGSNRQQKSRTMLTVGLSALVCPGSGQFLQKRWVPAIAVLTVFSGGTVWMLVGALRVLYIAYFTSEIVNSGLWLELFLSLAVVMVCWIANVVDVLLGDKSERKRQTGEPVS